MTRNRRGEKGAVPFRSGRLFRIDSEWYFATREVAHVGPYTTRDRAEVAMAAFIGSRIHHSAGFMKQALVSGGERVQAGPSEAFGAMVSEAAQFFAAWAREQLDAARLSAVERLKLLRADADHDHTAGCRVAVLEHILEAIVAAEQTAGLFVERNSFLLPD